MFLKNNFVFSFIIFAAVFFVVKGKHICSLNTVVNLQADTVEFIETPDFPRFLTPNEIRNCMINFTKTLLPEEKGKEFRLRLTNVICGSNNTVFKCDPYDISDIVIEDMTSFSYIIEYYSNIVAYQGYAVFDDWGPQKCLLQSVTKMDPFHFTDETQILLLDIDFYFWNCWWQFTSPPKYRFKFVIEDLYCFSLDLKTHHELISVNKTVGTYWYIEGIEKKKIDVYYIYGGYLSINVSTYCDQGKIKFNGYLSIVTYDEDKVETNCTVSEHDGIVTWTNFDIINGYPPNAKCTYNSIVTKNREIIVTKKHMMLEKFFDQVNFYPDGITNSPIDLNQFVTSNFGVILSGNEDGTDKYVPWEFLSDGNIQSLGFEINFEEIKCSCSESLIIVPCQFESPFTIMPYNPVLYSDVTFYCGNLRCNFVIKMNETCPEKNVKMTIKVDGDQFPQYDEGAYIYDVFRVISNNVTTLEINHLNRNQLNFVVYLPSIAENILQVITIPSLYYRRFEANLEAIKSQDIVPKIVLTAENPYYIFYMYSKIMPYIFDVVLSDELISKNATIDIHSLYEFIDVQSFQLINIGISFYNSPNLTREILFNNCFIPNTPFEYMCKTNRSQLTILQSMNHYSVLLFQASTVHSEGCVFQNNVVYVDGNTKVASIMSNNKTSCTAFIMTNINVFRIKDIWLSPTSKNVTIFAGAEKKKFATISAKTASSWHNIILNSLIYICDIPPNSVVQFSFGNNFIDHINPISAYPYHSIFASLYYGDVMTYVNYEFDYGYVYNSYSISKYNVKFSILHYNVPPDVHFYFSFNETIINITSTLPSQTFSNTNVSILNDCHIGDDDCHIGDVCRGSIYNIVILIESIEDTLFLPTTKYITTTSETSTKKQLSTTSSNGENTFKINFVFVQVFVLLIVYTFE